MGRKTSGSSSTNCACRSGVSIKLPKPLSSEASVAKILPPTRKSAAPMCEPSSAPSRLSAILRKSVPFIANHSGSSSSVCRPNFIGSSSLLSPRLSWYVDFSSCKSRATSKQNMIRSYKGVTPQFPDTCYVDDSAQLIGDVILGEHSSIWMNAVLRGDVHQIRVGHYSNIQDNCVLHGMKEQYAVYVGDYVTVGHNAILHGCTIEARCLIGMGSIILNGTVIGSGSIIAAGTLIPEGTIVEPNSLWMGSPGKFRRLLEKEDEESILRYADNYVGYKRVYLRERRT